MAQETAGRDDLDSGIAANGILEVMPDDMGLSGVKITFQGKKTFMSLRPKSANLI